MEVCLCDRTVYLIQTVGVCTVMEIRRKMEETTARRNWDSWLDFLFSVIGGMVGLGNVWRFPYVCYINGGAAFLIPYLLLMVVCGVPIFFLEMSVSQFSNLGPGRVWIVCPLFRGIGYGMVVITAVVSLYYAAIVAWALYYLAMSFSNPLPWTSCDNGWNTNSCFPTGFLQQAKDQDPDHNHTSGLTPVLSVFAVANMTSANITATVNSTESSVVQFWRNHVLQDRGHSIGDLGDLRWQLVLCLLAIWAVAFFTHFKDIKTFGKVMYVAAVLPYVVLLALLIRGSLLPGAVDGLLFYLVPKWHRLLDWQVWLAAASQVFFSTAIGTGIFATLSSFNRFHNNVYRDALVLPVLDAMTSVFAGFVIFIYVGYMAHMQNTTVDEVVTQGTGLAFIAYPEALATMPLPQFWAVLFFLVLFTVGLDTHFVHVQTLSSAIVDTWPRRFGHRKRWVTLVVCIVGFVLGLPFVTQGGQYVLKLCDWYVAAVSLMLMAVAETVILSWIYGTDRLYKDITMMIGFRLSPVWLVFWRFISPGVLLVMWTLGISEWKPIEDYPGWTLGVGWVIAVTPLLVIPVMAVRFLASLRPSAEWKPARPQDGDQDEDQCLRETGNFIATGKLTDDLPNGNDIDENV
ncbi:sodium- and chloride-dependent GABA transporter 2-like [Babylonia areolata]|uniref:sodium- and chloride-dependent GABA transporter 2-like n=1 Tax=Babylonia areolata TaxID=304850 RepID=UPI003FD4CCC2